MRHEFAESARRDMPMHCNHGNAWHAKLGKKKAHSPRSIRDRNVRFTGYAKLARTPSCATAVPLGNQKMRFPKPCGSRSVMGPGPVCIVQGKHMACGLAVPAAQRNLPRSTGEAPTNRVSRTASRCGVSETTCGRSNRCQRSGPAGPAASQTSRKRSQRKKGTHHIADVWEEIRGKRNSAAAVAPNDSGTKRQRSNVSPTALHAVQQPERTRQKVTWRQDPFESATYPQHSHRQSPVQPCKQRNEAAETLEARPNAMTGKVQKHKQRRYQMSAKCRPSQRTQWHLQRKTKMKPREGFDMSARFVKWLSRAACAQDKLTTAMHAGGSGRARCWQSIRLRLPFLHRGDRKQCEDRAHKPPYRVREPILR